MNSEERKCEVSRLAEEAITKIRRIKRIATRGDQVQEYDFQGLTEICESLRRNVGLLKIVEGGNPLIDIP